MPATATTRKGQPKVNPKLKAFLVDVGKLHLDDRNARRHPNKNVQAIADLLDDVGQQTTIIVDGDGKIIKGNGTFMAATQLLGWKKIAAIQFDGDTGKARRYGIGDNRAGELAEWDFRALAGLAREELAAGGKLAGWDDHELEPLLKAEWAPPPPSDTDAFTPDGRQRGQNRGHLFAEFAPEQQQVVLAALTKARKKHGDVTNEQAIVIICEEFVRG